MDAAMARVAGELIINHIEKAITEIYEEQTKKISREQQQEELAKEMEELQAQQNTQKNDDELKQLKNNMDLQK